MRPAVMTPAHRTGLFAELVCSNSLGAVEPDRGLGLLKAELRMLGSLILDCAEKASVPAGGALAVDRHAFSEMVTSRVQSSPLIEVVREEVKVLPGGVVVVATGPLTSPALTEQLGAMSGSDHLCFYDAMAPIVAADSVDMRIAFRASRYGRGEADYLNCPLNREEYYRFVDALVGAEVAPLRDFERDDARFFDACLPVEEIARRGRDAMAFGPLRPVGLVDPRTGKRPYAVVQLRQDDKAGRLYNMVGFQTNLKWGEQEKVFRLIPGLAAVRFVRFGQMHRNTFLDSPKLLSPTLQWRTRAELLFAGQITGTEGYVGSTASGLLAGINASRLARGMEAATLPVETMIGALLRYISTPSHHAFQPMKANFGLLPEVQLGRVGRRHRNQRHVERAMAALKEALPELEK
jgi:methylenetetrahydrofolate--tRNA-(uracil-5-)-methyltransferase